MYAVIVDFKTKAEHATAFRDAIVANARASVADEPGCSQFDVCVDPQDGTRIFLYEIYDDLAAFRRTCARRTTRCSTSFQRPWSRPRPCASSAASAPDPG